MLAVLFGTPDRTFYSNEVIALARSGTGAVQRELTDLTAAGLLTVRKLGNQKHYQANAGSPVFAELRGLVLKTMGLADVLLAALMPLAAEIDLAFVYGSVAGQGDTSQSDVDVMIVSPNLGYAVVFGALEAAGAALSRKINPTLYTPVEFNKRRTGNNAFVKRVLQRPRIWLIGNEDALHAGT